MYGRAILAAEGGFADDLRRCEDYDAYLRLSLSFPVACHPAVVAEYRMHGANMSRDSRVMLRAVLDVHKRYRMAARASRASTAAWQDGRRNWRLYYANEAIEAALAAQAGRSIPAKAWAAVRAGFYAPQALIDRAVAAGRRRFASRRHVRGRARVAVGQVDFGDLASTDPISHDFGYDRGTPIDRYYIETFLASAAELIRGHVLEVGDDAYTRRFGTDLSKVDVLHVHPGNPKASIIGDVSQPGVLPEARIRLHRFHPDAPSRFRHEGGPSRTAPGAQAWRRPSRHRARHQPDRQGRMGKAWYWALTPASANRLFREAFAPSPPVVQAHGNVFAACAFLQGLAVEEVDAAKLDVFDEAYPTVISVRAVRSAL